MKGIQDTLFRTLLPTLSLLWAASALAVPRHVYLTWQGDPSTSVTINYHTLEKAVMSEVRYDTQSRAEQGSRATTGGGISELPMRSMDWPTGASYMLSN